MRSTRWTSAAWGDQRCAQPSPHAGHVLRGALFLAFVALARDAHDDVDYDRDSLIRCFDMMRSSSVGHRFGTHRRRSRWASLLPLALVGWSARAGPPDAGRSEPISIDAGAPVSPPGFGVGRFALDAEELRTAQNKCEQLRALKSRCARDLDCELVHVGCEEVAFGPADLARARQLSSVCRGLEMCVPEAPDLTAAVCVKHRCVAQPLPSDVPPEQLCLDRALERAPRDKQPIIVELVPTIGGRVKAAAQNDSREVARCLERVLEQYVLSAQPVMLRYTPGERLKKFPPMTGRMPPLKTMPPPRPTTKSVAPLDSGPND